MFNYNLKGKQVILVLDKEFTARMKFAGIEGSPLVARVHRQEDDGLWVRSASFPVCPTGVPKLYRPDGAQFCKADIFIPAGAMLSVVAFPTAVPKIEEDAALYRIGFRSKRKGKRGRSRG